jgi:hypothetical protein
MTKEQKLVALCAFLPVLGDFIEDLNDQYVFKQSLKRKANILLEEIHRIDARVLRVDGPNEQAIWNQQIELQQLFRNWAKESIEI